MLPRMISLEDLRPKHVGKKVVYRPAFAPNAAPEHGVITSWNDTMIFVRYRPGGGSAATNPRDLSWE